jgi:hypothetical protein
MLDAFNATDTVATGTTMVAVAEPLTPSLVAVMLAVPVLTAVTTPVPETVATAVLELDHEIVRPVSTLFDASRRVAIACVVCPTGMLLDPSDTLTLATGVATVVTVTVVEAETPSLVA